MITTKTIHKASFNFKSLLLKMRCLRAVDNKTPTTQHFEINTVVR